LPAIDPAGKALVWGDWTSLGTGQVSAELNVWDLTGNRLIRRLPLGENLGPFATAFHPDGRTVVISALWNERSIRLWDLKREQEIVAIPTGVPRISPEIAFSPDGRLLASAGGEGTVHLWESATGKEIFLLKGHDHETTAVAFSPDGRIVASADGGWRPSSRNDGKASRIYRIILWDAVTGRQLQSWQEHGSSVTSLAFSPHGRQLASGLQNSTILLWDIRAAFSRLRRPVEHLEAAELEPLWRDLAGDDARKGYIAIGRLASSPRETVDFLASRLRRAPAVDPERLQSLIRDLDSSQFGKREEAHRELERLADQAERALRQALAGKISLETRRRIEKLWPTVLVPKAKTLQGVRAVAVLERIGTPEARKLLRTLSAGAAEARLTTEAKASLRRLER
jgi:hypothetical protein